MKRCVLSALFLTLCGCGDTTNVTTTGSTSTTGVTQNQVQGAADFIPSNEACTTDMNFIYTQNGKPSNFQLIYTNNSSHDGIFWMYPTLTVKFEWYSNSTICVSKQILPPPPTIGNAPFIPSGTYCTAKMNEQFAIHGLSQNMRADDNYQIGGYHRHTWAYPSEGIDLAFTWSNDFFDTCDFSTNSYPPVVPPTPPAPPIIQAGASAFILSNTYCTSDMNTTFALHGIPEGLSTSTSSNGSNSQNWNYMTAGLFISFYWDNYNGVNNSTNCSVYNSTQSVP